MIRPAAGVLPCIHERSLYAYSVRKATERPGTPMQNREFHAGRLFLVCRHEKNPSSGMGHSKSASSRASSISRAQGGRLMKWMCSPVRGWTRERKALCRAKQPGNASGSSVP